MPKEKINLLPALKFNGSGNINHALFSKNLAPISQDGGENPRSPLKDALEADFDSVDGGLCLLSRRRCAQC